MNWENLKKKWEELNKNSLPDVAVADDGKVAKVVNGDWGMGADEGLPAVSATDNGSVLKVVDGAWAVGESSGGGILRCAVAFGEEDTVYLNKTYAEIAEGFMNGIVVVESEEGAMSAINIVMGIIPSTLTVVVGGDDYTAESENGYPVHQSGK